MPAMIENQNGQRDTHVLDDDSELHQTRFQRLLYQDNGKEQKSEN